MILFHLMNDAMRFGELQRAMGNITQRMLTKQLRELEDVGLIHREIFSEVPPRVEYSLNEKGHTLRPVLLALKEWGESYGLELAQSALAIKDRQDGPPAQ